MCAKALLCWKGGVFGSAAALCTEGCWAPSHAYVHGMGITHASVITRLAPGLHVIKYESNRSAPYYSYLACHSLGSQALDTVPAAIAARLSLRPLRSDVHRVAEPAFLQ